MKLEQIINDTQNFSQRVQAVAGPQIFGGSLTLVAELSRVVGVLAESVLITEGKRPPTRAVDLAHDLADVLFVLAALSATYHIDLELAWNEWMAQTHIRLDDDTFVNVIRDRLSTSRANRQKR